MQRTHPSALVHFLLAVLKEKIAPVRVIRPPARP
jgi:hypothetical protein